MGAVKVSLPRNIDDRELLRRAVESLCVEVNRPLVVDVNLPLIALTGGATPTPTAYGGGEIRYAGFVHTIDKDVDGVVELPHGARLVQSITPHIHYFPSTSGAGNIKFDLTYVLCQPDVVEPAETVISVTKSASGIAGKNETAVFPAISMSLEGPNAQFCFNIKRDTSVASNYGATVLAKTVGIHVTLEATGSRTITTL